MNDVSTYINTYVRMHTKGRTIIPLVIQGHHRFFSNFLILELQNLCYAGKELQNVECIGDLALRLGMDRKRGQVGLYWIAKRPTALGIPRWSPIQVLTQHNSA